jgi:hypothetical protein
MDFQKLFQSAFRVREIGTDRVLDCVQMADAFECPCPDAFELRDVERVVEEKSTVYDPKIGKMKDVMTTRTEVSQSKVYDFAAGAFHGGNIRGRAGDYVFFDGTSYFSCLDKDPRGVPVFDKRFLKL